MIVILAGAFAVSYGLKARIWLQRFSNDAVSPSGGNGSARTLRSRFRDAFVYSPLAFAETAESIELVQRGLRVQPGDTVAGITSSGDVLLSLLASNPKRIHGFDANPTQTALARLKRELCTDMPVDEAMSFLGLTAEPPDQRLRKWHALKPRLGPAGDLLERFDIGAGLLNCGTTRKLFRLTVLGLRLCLGSDGFRRLVSPDSTPASRMQLLNEARQRGIYRWLIRPTLAAGRRPFQHFLYPPALCSNSDHPQRALNDILESYSRLFEVGLAENPVFERFMTGRVPDEQVRQLYSDEAWPVLRQRIGDISFETLPITQGLLELSPCSTDAFYLSNAPDYLRPDGLRSLSDALSRASRPGARVFYLSLDSQCPFECCGVPIPFARCNDVEQSLTRADTVGLYRFIGVRCGA